MMLTLLLMTSKIFGLALFGTVCGFALLDKSTLRQNHVQTINCG